MQLGRDLWPASPARQRGLTLALAFWLAASAAAGNGGPIRARRAVGAPAMAAARILAGQEGGTLPLAVVALYDRRPGDERVVPVLVRVDGEAFLAAAGDDPRPPLGFFVYALSADGRVAATVSEIVRVDLEGRRSCLERGGLDFVAAVSLPPGRYSLRVLVRGADAADSGLRVVEIEVPGDGADGPSMLAPLFRSSARDCLALQQSIAEGELSLPFPKIEDPPTAGATVAAGSRAEFELLAAGRPADQPLVLELYDGSLRLAATLPVELLGAEPDRAGWPERLRAAVETGDLEPGAYRARVRWGEGPAGSTASGWLALKVAGAAGSGAAAAAPPVLAGKLPAVATQGAAAYRRALGTLAGGDWLAAQTAVAALERAAVDLPGEGALEELGAAQGGVMEEIAATATAALIPVYVLHRNLHNAYRADRQFLLAQHARARAQRAIDLFLESTTWLEGREIGADLLANLAGDLQRIGVLKTSEALFQRAVALLPQHRAALMGLGAGLERRGANEAAAEVFESVVRISPDDRHAALRLAINLRRAGEGREARRRLEQLVQAESPPWVLSLACQELAGLRLERGEPEAAEEVLRGCLERRPLDEKLLLQLAFVLSGTGRPGEARGLLAERSFQAGAGRAASARFRYSLWPAEDLAATRDRVRGRALAELATLATALGAPGEEVAP